MHRTGVCACAALAALLAAPWARAQTEGGTSPLEGYARTGVYAGLAGAVAFDDFSSDVSLPGLEGSAVPVALGGFDPSLGLHARAGYRALERVAGELHFEWLSGFDGQSVISGVPLSATIETLAVSADVKLYPLLGRYQPFLILGLGVLGAEETTTNTDEWDFAARLGGGIDVYVTDHIAVNLDVSYVLPLDQLSGYEYVSLGWGLLYRF